MHRFAYPALAGLLALALASCGGGNNEPAATGTVSGDIDVVGPSNGAVELNVGLFGSGDTPLQTAVGGHVTSAATASLNGRQLDFSFTDVDPGTYTVRVYASAGGSNTYYYTSEQFTTTASSLNKTFSNESFSFAGPQAHGTISALIMLPPGTTAPAGTDVFVGFESASSPGTALRWPVDVAEASAEGYLYINVDGLTADSWTVTVFSAGEDDEQSLWGRLDDPVTIAQQDPFKTVGGFPADPAGDPGEDPTLGSISGIITFSAALPPSAVAYVGANTIPPQRGAPPSSMLIVAPMLDGENKVAYNLPQLPDDDYGVAIFAYDFATHQAVYFGEVDAPVTVSGGTPLTGIDFDADVSIISGS